MFGSENALNPSECRHYPKRTDPSFTNGGLEMKNNIPQTKLIVVGAVGFTSLFNEISLHNLVHKNCF